jgi:hypothetical protein
VGRLWTSDQPEAQKTHNTHKRQTFTLPTGFELTIKASERLHTNAVGRAANGVAVKPRYFLINLNE